MECIFTSPEQPLIVFVPTEFTMNEYKNYMTVALSSIDQYKRQGKNLMDQALELQYKLEKIIFDFSLPLLENQDLQNAIPDHLKKKCELHVQQEFQKNENGDIKLKK